MHDGIASNLGDLISRSADNSKTSFIEIGETGNAARFTHTQIDERTEDFAAALQSGGYAQGESVAIIAKNSVNFLIAYLGTMRAGLIAVPISYRQPLSMIEYCLRDSEARIVLTDDVAIIPNIGIPVVLLAKGMADSISNGDLNRRFKPVSNGPRDVAMILYTSGSTGAPKGVELSHKSQLFSLSVFEPQRAFATDQVLSIAAPLYHMNGLSLCKLALLMNATVVLFSTFEAESVIRAIPKYGITWLTGIPTMYALMADRPEILEEADLSKVKRVTLGSSPLTDNLVDILRKHLPDAQFVNSYGTTEHGPSAFAPHPSGLSTPQLSLGCTAPGVETRLVDGPDDNFGVLEVRSPANLNGYKNLPEVTSERLIDGWYHTPR
jgi:long-chain acyl-CoA synthetase